MKYNETISCLVYYNWGQKRYIGKIGMRGFSLIELMVVIAIVAVLSAVALPAYKDYTLKAKIAKVLPIADRLLTEVKQKCNLNGTCPSSIDVNGFNIPSTSWIEVNYENIRSVYYAVAADGLGVRFHFSLTGLEGIPNYSSPAYPPSNSYSVIVFGSREINSNMQTVCGHSSLNNTNMIPLSYMPAVCNCADISSFMTSGTGC